MARRKLPSKLFACLPFTPYVQLYQLSIRTTTPLVVMAAVAAAASLRQLLLRSSSRTSNYTCPRCRHLSSSTVLTSGHNRWSKIKHDKGKSDVQKNKQRSELAKELMQASKSLPWTSRTKFNHSYSSNHLAL